MSERGLVSISSPPGARGIQARNAAVALLLACLIGSERVPPLASVTEPTPSTRTSDLTAGVQRAVAEREYEASVSSGGLQAPNRAHNLRAYFEPTGVRVHDRTAPGSPELLRLAPAGLGRRTALAAVSPGDVTHAGARVEINRPGLAEWYLNSDAGLEQGFTLAQPPAGDGALVLELELGTATASPLGDDLVFTTPTGRRLRYGALRVVDASGRALSARFELPSPGNVRIAVDDAGAAYPIVIDPLLTEVDDTRIESNLGTAQLGFSAVADVNGDGYGDLIVGAHLYDNPEGNEGAVFVFHGGPSGIADGDPSNADAQIESDQGGARLGHRLANAGDVNGDGYDDLIVAAFNYDNPEANEGAAFVFHGGPLGVEDGNPGNADAVIESNQPGAVLTEVAGAGDVNGDGYSDVVVGFWRYNWGVGESDEGAAFVFHGSASGIVANGHPGNADAVLQGDQVDAEFGFDVDGAGDVNGDGYDDLIVSADSYTNGMGETFEGAVFVYHGGAAGIGNGGPATAETRLESNQASAFLGFAVAGVGDVNGDGYADVAATAYRYDSSEEDEGAVFVFHGSASGVVANGDPTNADSVLESNTEFGFLSVSVSGAGDVNGDGYADLVVGGFTDGAVVFAGSATGIPSGDPTSALAVLLPFDWGVSAGDVNGDGYSDVVVGAYLYDGGETDEGAAFVYHGGAQGIVDADPTTAAAQLESDQATAYLGVSVAGAGDVNADGFADVIVGASLYDAGQTDEGAAFVFLGSASGIADASPATASAQLEADQESANFGSAVAGAGDVNGDGYADVIVGAPFYDAGESNEGAVFVFLGGASGIADGTPVTAAAQIEADQVDAWLGLSVAGAGDVNGDGYADVVAATRFFDAGQTDEGAAFVFLGGASGIADGNPSTAAAQLEGNQDGAGFGRSAAGAGDVNGDGYADLIVSAYLYDSGETDEGAAFVFLGGPPGITDGGPNTAATRLEADLANAQFGVSVAGAGDVDGDRYADVIVGSRLYDADQTDEGAAFVFHGSATGVADGNPSNATAQLESDQASALFGVSVAGAGDVNGDGYADVIVGAEFYDGGLGDEGGAFMFLGSALGVSDGSPATAAAQILSAQETSDLGYSVAGAGDVNGDGFADVIAGAAFYDAGLTDEGAAFVLYGGGNRSGRSVLARQQRSVGPDAPVQAWGRSNDLDGFDVRMVATSPRGRDRVKLQVEVCAPSFPFGHATCATQTQADWTAIIPPVSEVTLTHRVTGLDPNTLHRWRARVLHARGTGAVAPVPEHGPWRRLGAQAVEADVRTQLGDSDSDDDGLLDTFELANGFDPLDADEDNDGRIDGQDDFDSDGLGNAAEAAAGTNPNVPDSDADGLSDGAEIGTGVFGPQLVISNVADGAWSVVAADVDGDGDSDVLSASDGDDTIAWHENDGTPATGPWTEHLVSTTAAEARSVFAADVDGDGDTDLLSASFLDDTVAWHENDGTPAVGSWTEHTISTAANGARSVFAADVDSDGDMDALAASGLDDTIAWYENDGTPELGAWTEHEISTTAFTAAAVFAVDLDADGDTDVLSASSGDDTIAWYENDGTPELGAWAEHSISTSSDGAKAVFAADVDGDGDTDVVSTAYLEDTIAWLENDGTPAVGAWTEHPISTSAASASWVFAADLDGDGDTDVASAAWADDTIAWHENDGTPAAGLWPEHEISALANGAQEVFVADLDGDGDADVLSASEGDDKIAWYPQQNVADPLDPDSDDDGLLDGLELANGFDPLDPDEDANNRVDGQDDFDADGLGNAAEAQAGTNPNDSDSDNDGLLDGAELGTGLFGAQLVISTAADGAVKVLAVDVDGDGDKDVLSASEDDNKIAWYENDGTPSPGTWTEHVISTSSVVLFSVFAADVDGDGDADVLSASYLDYKIAWYENDGTPAVGAWPEHAVSTSAAGATSVFAADVDGDGDTDVLSASWVDDKIAWYENDGTPSLGSWAEHPISTTAVSATSVFAVDVDGDGDTDVLSASYYDDKIAWYENDGTPSVGSWAEHSISTAADSATSVFAADVDGDGDTDVLSGSVADNKIAWYENDGTPSSGAWSEHVISTAADSYSIVAADVDGDGDTDVLSVSYDDDKIAWYENDGTPSLGAWSEHAIWTIADGAHSVFAADVDGDGDTDVLSASVFDDKIAWYAQQNFANPLDPDSDDDALLDGVETDTGIYVSPSDTGTDPLDADSDDDGSDDGVEVAQGSNPNDSGSQPLVIGFDRLDGGSFFTCGILTNGELACFGSAPSDQPTTGTFESLAAGTNFACALDGADMITCWGSGAPTLVGTTYKQIAAGTGHVCGLLPDLTIECWGNDAAGQVTDSPGGQFNEVISGSSHSCALALDGHVECWGANASSQMAVLGSEVFVQLSAGLSHTCGLRADRSVRCWDSGEPGETVEPPGSFTQLASGSTHTCGLTLAGTIQCWGGNASGQTDALAGTFIGVFAGPSTSCGIRADHRADCWGANGAGEATPPLLPFPDVALGDAHGCELSPAGAIRCFGDDSSGQSSPPPTEPLVAIGVGLAHSCAIEADGDVVCFGGGPAGEGESQPASGDPFVQIDGGSMRSCGVRASGTLTCWGEDIDCPLTSDPGTFRQVSVGGVAGNCSHTCGVTTDDAVACSGRNSVGQASPPSGAWRQVSAGGEFSCGVRSNLTLACWGASAPSGQPSGMFTQVEAGRAHACALETNGTVRCWGDSSFAQTTPPPGSYERISAGGDTSCGVLDDGSIACWGDDSSGQASPALDGDDDNRADGGDNCPTAADFSQADTDLDGVGDGVMGDLCDVCPDIPDPDQFDRDADGVGDACDNCADVFNLNQADLDGNGVGDLCEIAAVVLKRVTPPPQPAPPPGVPLGMSAGAPAPPPAPGGPVEVYDVSVYCPTTTIHKVELGVIVPQGTLAGAVDFGPGCSPTLRTCALAVVGEDGLGDTVNKDVSFWLPPIPTAMNGVPADTLYFSLQGIGTPPNTPLCIPPANPADATVRVARFTIDGASADTALHLTTDGLEEQVPPMTALTDASGELEPVEYSLIEVVQTPALFLRIAPAAGDTTGMRWQVELDTDLELYKLNFAMKAPATASGPPGMTFLGCTQASSPPATRRDCAVATPANPSLGPYVQTGSVSFTVGPQDLTPGLRTDALYVSLEGARTSSLGFSRKALNVAGQPVLLGVVELSNTLEAPILDFTGVGTTTLFPSVFTQTDPNAAQGSSESVQREAGYNVSSDFDADQRPDDFDNCPYTANPNQLNRGGLLTTIPDLFGDVCQCADGFGEGAVCSDAADCAADTAALRDALTGQATAAVVSRCSVAGGPECDVRDYVVFRRAVAGLDGPGITSVCASAVRDSQAPPAP